MLGLTHMNTVNETPELYGNSNINDGSVIRIKSSLDGNSSDAQHRQQQHHHRPVGNRQSTDDDDDNNSLKPPDHESARTGTAKDISMNVSIAKEGPKYIDDMANHTSKKQLVVTNTQLHDNDAAQVQTQAQEVKETIKKQMKASTPEFKKKLKIHSPSEENNVKKSQPQEQHVRQEQIEQKHVEKQKQKKKSKKKKKTTNSQTKDELVVEKKKAASEGQAKQASATKKKSKKKKAKNPHPKIDAVTTEQSLEMETAKGRPKKVNDPKRKSKKLVKTSVEAKAHVGIKVKSMEKNEAKGKPKKNIVSKNEAKKRVKGDPTPQNEEEKEIEGKDKSPRGKPKKIISSTANNSDQIMEKHNQDQKFASLDFQTINIVVHEENKAKTTTCAICNQHPTLKNSQPDGCSNNSTNKSQHHSDHLGVGTLQEEQLDDKIETRLVVGDNTVISQQQRHQKNTGKKNEGDCTESVKVAPQPNDYHKNCDSQPPDDRMKQKSIGKEETKVTERTKIMPTLRRRNQRPDDMDDPKSRPLHHSVKDEHQKRRQRRLQKSERDQDDQDAKIKTRVIAGSKEFVPRRTAKHDRVRNNHGNSSKTVPVETTSVAPTATKETFDCKTKAHASSDFPDNAAEGRGADSIRVGAFQVSPVCPVVQGSMDVTSMDTSLIPTSTWEPPTVNFSSIDKQNRLLVAPENTPHDPIMDIEQGTAQEMALRHFPAYDTATVTTTDSSLPTYDTVNEQAIVAELVPEEGDVAQGVVEQLETQLAERLQREVSDRLREERQHQVLIETVQIENANEKHTDQSTNYHYYMKWIALFVCSMILVAVVVSVVFVILKRDDDMDSKPILPEYPVIADPPTNADPPIVISPTISGQFEELFEVLRPYIFQGEQVTNSNVTSGDPAIFSVENLTNYQFEALDWLANIDGANVTVAIDDELEHLEKNESDTMGLTVQMVVERFALAVMFFANDGTKWIDSFGFLNDMSVCHWNNGANESGIFCGDEENPSQMVTHISMPDNAIVGTFPTELMLLTNLEWIDLDLNSIYGSLPRKIYSLSNLKVFWFQDNALTGKLLTEIGLLTNLVSLDIRDNAMEGTIPTELGLLHALKDLPLRLNDFSGTIPTQIGNLESLTHIDFEGCLLTGTIPSQLGYLTNMTWLYMEENDLTGTIPSEFGALTNLEELFLFSNPIHGTIPTELSALTMLSSLIISDTDLTGDLGMVFCDNRYIFNNETNSTNLNYYNHFWADCLSQEITCSCCTVCCNTYGTSCIEMSI